MLKRTYVLKVQLLAMSNDANDVLRNGESYESLKSSLSNYLRKGTWREYLVHRIISYYKGVCLY